MIISEDEYITMIELKFPTKSLNYKVNIIFTR